MLKGYIPAALALLVFLGGQGLVWAADSSVAVIIDGRQETLEAPPRIVNGHVLVAMHGIPEKLGATVEWDPSIGNVTLTKNQVALVLTVGSPFAVQNGFRVRLDAEPIEDNGTVWIPIQSVSQLLGGDAEWVQSSQTLVLSANGPIVQSGGTPSADTPLTYDKAVNLALSSSYRVQNALQDVARAKQVLEKASDNVQYIPSRGGDAVATKIFTGYTQASIAYEMSQKAYGMTQDVVAYAVKQAYNGILQAQAQQAAAEAALKNAQVQADIATVGHQYGTVSDIQWQQAVQALQAAQASVQAADKAVTDAYQRLNSLIGLPADARYQITDQPQVSDLKGVDPETQVSRVISDSPSIWQAEQQVNLAKLQLDLYTFNDPNNPDPYEAKQIDVQKAYNSEADLRDQLSRSVWSAYNSLQELQAQYQSLQSQLAAAEQSLKLAQIQYQYGTGIQADVVAAQAKVDQLKQQLANTAAQFDNLKMVFEKPWVAGGSGSTSGTSSGGSAG